MEMKGEWEEEEEEEVERENKREAAGFNRKMENLVWSTLLLKS